MFVNAERGDDTWALAAGDPDYTVSTVKYDSAFMILNPYSLFNTNWVGFGDTADYRALELLDSGSYNFTVSQLAGKATGKFTLWKLRDDGKLKKMFTVNAGSKKPAVKSNVLLESGSYVIAFESKNWKSGHNTDYTVMLDGTAFGQANRREDNDWQHATAVSGISRIISASRSPPIRSVRSCSPARPAKMRRSPSTAGKPTKTGTRKIRSGSPRSGPPTASPESMNS